MYKVFFNDRVVCIGGPFNKSLIQRGLLIRAENEMNMRMAWEEFRIGEGRKYLLFEGKDPEKMKQWFFGLFTTVTAAGGLVRNEKNELLCIFRYGKWDLPKGKVEKGESLSEAARREVEEECGLCGLAEEGLVTVTHHIYLNPRKKDQWILKPTYWFAFFYKGSTQPVPQQAESIERAVWFGKNDLPRVMENTWESLNDIFSDWINFG
ncbi:MAG TPA: NUDIX domain-containing protein [Prolixibacteraceae bacterium]|nr:NUDIX domain-containing protein [Prolixibacteraceae bacterium]